MRFQVLLYMVLASTVPLPVTSQYEEGTDEVNQNLRSLQVEKCEDRPERYEKLCGKRSTCVNDADGPRCKCNDGYLPVANKDRNYCVDVNECEGFDNPCDPFNGFCVDWDPPIKYRCGCRPGYRGSGEGFFGCFIDFSHPCRTGRNDCSDDANCIPDSSQQGYTCACERGFIGNGIVCEREPRPLPTPQDTTSRGRNPTSCSELTCEENQQCGMLGSPPKPTCFCKDGYFSPGGVGSRCFDVNECDDIQLNRCALAGRSVCVNTQGGYRCQCATGFQKLPRSIDGTVCLTDTEMDEVKGGTELDIATLNLSLNFPATDFASLIPSPSTSTSTVNSASSSGPPPPPAPVGSCDDITCHDNQKCGFYGNPPTPQCGCREGYFAPGGVGSRCFDVDECLDPELNMCALGGRSVCVNLLGLQGKYRCQCATGFQKLPRSIDGTVCLTDGEMSEVKQGRTLDIATLNLSLNFPATDFASLIPTPDTTAPPPAPAPAPPRPIQIGSCDDITCHDNQDCGMFGELEQRPRCFCRDGYFSPSGVGGPCFDVNECLDPELNRCALAGRSVCVDLPGLQGGYRCQCATGFQKLPRSIDGTVCLTDGEMELVKGGTQLDIATLDLSLNLPATDFDSLIPKPVVINLPNSATVDDPPSEAEQEALRQQLCANMDCGPARQCGLFGNPQVPKCFCKPGYFSPSGVGGACFDINECLTPSMTDCAVGRSVCVNLDGNKGGFRCQCASGWQRLPGSKDGTICISQAELDIILAPSSSPSMAPSRTPTTASSVNSGSSSGTSGGGGGPRPTPFVYVESNPTPIGPVFLGAGPTPIAPTPTFFRRE